MSTTAGEVLQPAGESAAASLPAGSLIARQVADFHRSFELPLRTSPTAEVGREQVDLRLALIEEEVAELRAAAEVGDLTAIADALADIVYVAYGSAHVYGIDLDAVLGEVHASNMTKLGADGRPVRRADGKVLKGPHYRPPEVAAVLAGKPGQSSVDTAPAAIPSDTLDP
jgi:predicted HAD superfamily Cof-like phosphohydrolase